MMAHLGKKHIKYSNVQFLHLTYFILFACLWCTCMSIIVINLRFGGHTFIPHNLIMRRNLTHYIKSHNFAIMN